jgi:hypothetical protein
MRKAIAECSLADLVEDPLVGLMMRSDGVDRHTVELLFERVAQARDVDGACSRPQDEEIPRCRSC